MWNEFLIIAVSNSADIYFSVEDIHHYSPLFVEYVMI